MQGRFFLEHARWGASGAFPVKGFPAGRGPLPVPHGFPPRGARPSAKKAGAGIARETAAKITKRMPGVPRKGQVYPNMRKICVFPTKIPITLLKKEKMCYNYT